MKYFVTILWGEKQRREKKENIQISPYFPQLNPYDVGNTPQQLIYHLIKML